MKQSIPEATTLLSTQEIEEAEETLSNLYEVKTELEELLGKISGVWQSYSITQLNKDENTLSDVTDKLNLLTLTLKELGDSGEASRGNGEITKKKHKRTNRSSGKKSHEEASSSQYTDNQHENFITNGIEELKKQRAELKSKIAATPNILKQKGRTQEYNTELQDVNKSILILATRISGQSIKAQEILDNLTKKKIKVAPTANTRASKKLKKETKVGPLTNKSSAQIGKKIPLSLTIGSLTFRAPSYTSLLAVFAGIIAIPVLSHTSLLTVCTAASYLVVAKTCIEYCYKKKLKGLEKPEAKEKSSNSRTTIVSPDKKETHVESLGKRLETKGSHVQRLQDQRASRRASGYAFPELV